MIIPFNWEVVVLYRSKSGFILHEILLIVILCTQSVASVGWLYYVYDNFEMVFSQQTQIIQETNYLDLSRLERNCDWLCIEEEKVEDLSLEN